MKTLNKFLNEYGFVILVGVYFALTSIYASCGHSKSVFWNSYIKIVRELFVVALIFMNFKRLKNIISILFGFSALAISAYLTVFRLMTAYISEGDYDIYKQQMQGNNQSLMFITFIFIIFVLANYINRRN